jgi:hypothetical protein
MHDPLTPLSPGQTAQAEQQASREGYLHRLLVGLDQFLNVVCDGRPDETISARAARAAEQGKPWGVELSRALNLFETNHGVKAQAGDLERAMAVMSAELNTGFVHPVTGKVCRLGRTRARRNLASRLRAAKLESFLAQALPDVPTSVDYTSGITNWGMMLNDQLGDCTIAGPGHLVQAWTAMAGSEVTVSDSAIETAYENWDGYVLGDPATDNGGDILTVCQDWQAQGLDGHGISAYAEVNPCTQLRIQQGIYLFGGLNSGVSLPLSAQGQVGSVWDVTGDGQTGDNAPGSWGGHCTAIIGYDPDGITLITWGAKQRATWRFVLAYYDEHVAIISPDWKNAPVDSGRLVADLQQIGS